MDTSDAASDRQWCLSCGRNQVLSEFEFFMNGMRKKTCKGCTRKRGVQLLFGDWDSFKAQIAAWNRPGQTAPLDLEETFDLDCLPVTFPHQMSSNPDESTNRALLERSINELSDIIWKSGGFRFVRSTAAWRYLRFTHYCSQDEARGRPSTATGQRDTHQMDRFPCKSHLSFKVTFENRSLKITIKHNYHEKYVDRSLSEEVLKFIDERGMSTPSDIFRELQVSKPSGWETVTQDRVYYRWKRNNALGLRSDGDPPVSDNVESTSGVLLDDNRPDSDDARHTRTEKLARMTEALKRALIVFEKEKALGNDKFLDWFMKAYASIITFSDECTTFQNSRTMPRTGANYKHPCIKYLS